MAWWSANFDPGRRLVAVSLRVPLRAPPLGTGLRLDRRCTSLRCSNQSMCTADVDIAATRSAFSAGG